MTEWNSLKVAVEGEWMVAHTQAPLSARPLTRTITSLALCIENRKLRTCSTTPSDSDKQFHSRVRVEAACWLIQEDDLWVCD